MLWLGAKTWARNWPASNRFDLLQFPIRIRNQWCRFRFGLDQGSSPINSEWNLSHAGWHPHARLTQGLHLGSSTSSRRRWIRQRLTARQRQTAEAPDRGARRHLLKRYARRNLLPAGTERRGKIHDRGHPDHARSSDQRASMDRRIRCLEKSGRGQAADRGGRATAQSGFLAHRPRDFAFPRRLFRYRLTRTRKTRRGSPRSL